MLDIHKDWGRGMIQVIIISSIILALIISFVYFSIVTDQLIEEDKVAESYWYKVQAAYSVKAGSVVEFINVVRKLATYPRSTMEEFANLYNEANALAIQINQASVGDAAQLQAYNNTCSRVFHNTLVLIVNSKVNITGMDAYKNKMRLYYEAGDLITAAQEEYNLKAKEATEYHSRGYNKLVGVITRHHTTNWLLFVN